MNRTKVGRTIAVIVPNFSERFVFINPNYLGGGEVIKLAKTACGCGMSTFTLCYELFCLFRILTILLFMISDKFQLYSLGSVVL